MIARIQPRTPCAPGDHVDVDVADIGMAHREFVCAVCGRWRTEPLPDTPLQDDVDDNEGDHRGLV